MTPAIRVENLHKTFVLHHQHGATLPVLRSVDLTVQPGECVGLHGVSGSGKSTLLRSLYGNYRASSGRILMLQDGDYLDLSAASPREILGLRRHTVGYVSQFLRVIPRVTALNVVAEPLRLRGTSAAEAEHRAAELLGRLNIPERLWRLAPSTFSGGEQQRINIARGFAVDYPVMLLDEPTAALDATNRSVVVALIKATVARGAAVVGIFHDAEVREAVCDRLFELERLVG